MRARKYRLESGASGSNTLWRQALFHAQNPGQVYCRTANFEFDHPPDCPGKVPDGSGIIQTGQGLRLTAGWMSLVATCKMVIFSPFPVGRAEFLGS